MAENEILDVGNPLHYKRWHRALADTSCSPSDAAEYLLEDFSSVFVKKLRGKPLYLILKACGHDRKALQDTVTNFKDRAIAKLVEQAYTITRSKDPQIVAAKVAELLIDRLADQANRYALKHDLSVDHNRHMELERATSARLETCRGEIIDLLAASLRGERIRGVGTGRYQPPSVVTLLATSLLPAPRKPSSETYHA